jgi:hypothetical protein
MTARDRECRSKSNNDRPSRRLLTEDSVATRLTFCGEEGAAKSNKKPLPGTPPLSEFTIMQDREIAQAELALARHKIDLEKAAEVAAAECPPSCLGEGTEGARVESGTQETLVGDGPPMAEWVTDRLPAKHGLWEEFPNEVPLLEYPWVRAKWAPNPA